MLGAPQPANFIGTHPVWHYAVVAAGAVGVFAGIKLYEHWRGVHAAREPGAAGGLRRTWPGGAAAWIVVIVALSSFGCSAVHAAVCPDHFKEWTMFGVFFVVASTLQAGWGVAVLWRPVRRLLAVGAAGNLAVVVLWSITRTVGLPVGPDVWKPEAASALDLMATTLELVIVAGATWLVLRDRRVAGSWPRVAGRPGRPEPRAGARARRPAELPVVRPRPPEIGHALAPAQRVGDAGEALRRGRAVKASPPDALGRRGRPSTAILRRSSASTSTAFRPRRLQSVMVGPRLVHSAR